MLAVLLSVGALLLAGAVTAAPRAPKPPVRSAAPPRPRALPAPTTAPSSQAAAAGILDRVSEILWDTADSYWHKGRYEDRIALDYLVIDLTPGFAEPYSTASWLIESNGRKDEAEAVLRQGTREVPDSWAVWSELGEFLYKHKRYREAAAALTTAAGKAEANPRVLHLLAHAYRQAGDLRKSLETWEEAQKREPGDGAVEMNLKKVRQLLQDKP